MADARKYILLIVAVLSNIYVVLRIVWPYAPQGAKRGEEELRIAILVI